MVEVDKLLYCMSVLNNVTGIDSSCGWLKLGDRAYTGPEF